MNEFLSLIQDTMAALALHYQPLTQPRLRERGFEGGDWYAIFLAVAAEPEPLLAADYQRVNPYLALGQAQETLAKTAGRGFLKAVGQASYRVTEAGREGLAEFFQVAREAMVRVDAPPEADLTRLADLLRRVVEATAAGPTDAAQLKASQTQAPSPDASAIIQIDQYLTDLATYRDDAHLAAWRPYEVEGHGWEAFTFIWRGQANTVAALTQLPQIQNRGYTAADYTAALSQLVERGWLDQAGEAYHLTEAGQKLRDQAEAQTDHAYYVGFSTLTEAELAELQTLLSQFRDKLRLAAVIDFWPLLSDIPNQWFGLTRPKVRAAFEQAEIEGRSFFTLWQTLEFAPEPATVDKYRQRTPYLSAQDLAVRLADLADKGLLTRVTADAYQLAAGVADRLKQVDDAFGQALADLDALPAADLETIKTTLDRVVEASLKADQPASKWALIHSHTHVREASAPLMLHIDQAIDDLNAFRDDCHLAAWRPYGVEGLAWEAFTFVWRGEANTAAALVEQLTTRGHPAEDYAAALQSLADRGWIKEMEGVYQTTAAGRTLREAVEASTDTAFYTPWFSLGAGEISQLRDLLTKLRDNLQTLRQEAEAAAQPA